MRPGLILLLGLLLAISAAAAAFALLPACGARLPFAGGLGFCPAPEAAAAEARLDALGAEAAELTREAALLERDLAARPCAASAPAPPPPPPPPIDAEAWSTRDIALLEGCWQLDSPFETTHTGTGVVSHYDDWRMCFGRDGAGHEEMRSDTGTTCAGPVAGAFDASGTLVIEEPANLACGDGGFIYRLTSRCDLKPDGTAACRLEQPELGRTGAATFRRVPGGE